jgi:class 3 adenylate cyclase/HEAT repeat protein
MQKRADRLTSELGRESKITVLTLLKNFYEEEIFRLLVKEIYSSDVEVSETAIRASGSLGNEVAIPHLYQMVERGKKPQRIAAIQALAAIKAPSSATTLMKYFTHFPEEDLRAELLRAVNAISPTADAVQELNQSVFMDPKQGAAVKKIAAEALVEGERFTLLKDMLPRAAAEVQEAAFIRMLQTGGQEVLDFTAETLSPTALGCYLCVYTLKAKSAQQNYILSKLQTGQKQILHPFLLSLTKFQGRLHFPTRVFRLLLIMPFVDTESEALVGDFLKKVVKEVKESSPHLLSEFSVITSAHLDTVLSKARKNFLSLRGINKKDLLLSTLLATLLEKYATPGLLEDVQRFFKAEWGGGTPPLAQLRTALAGAPREDQNKLEACIPLFTLTEKKDKIPVSAAMAKVDLNRPVYLRRLNRLIRVAGALEIKTTSKKIQEILDFSREERISFLEETAIVTLCQLLTRSIIEQSKEFFSQPTKNIRSLNGYIRGARFIPAKIMIGPLLHVLLHPALNPGSRELVVDTLLAMDLSGMRRIMPSLMKALDMPEVDSALKLRIGQLIEQHGDASIGHQLLDVAGHPDPVARRAAIRALKALARRGEGVAPEVLTNRLYLLLDDREPAVRVEAQQALLALSDDYAAQIVWDHVKSGDGATVSEILSGVQKPLSRETFSLVMDILPMEDAAVQKSLRALLPELSQGPFSEELRQALLDSLALLPKGGEAPPESVTPSPPTAESLIGQAKLEFKFKRENTQVLTVFFVDIAGYTEKSTTVDMSSLLKLIKIFEDIVSGALSANRGTIIKKYGDGILAVFKHPLNAVIAALEVQARITQYSSMRVEQEKFQVRIGLNTGPVIRKDADIFGEVVNVASRMQSAATPGDILLTQSTFEEVRDYVVCTELGRIQVKGIKEAIQAYSPEEVTVDVRKFREPGGAAEAGPQAGAASMEKLKESLFVPEFKLSRGAGSGPGVAGFLQEMFNEISQAFEDVATDYHEEYAFKEYLQRKWDQLMRKLSP